MSVPVNTVWEGDVFELLRQLEDQSVDMVFSDPDYNIGVRYNGRSYRQRWDDYIDWYIRLARESLRVLKDDGNAFFMNMPKQNDNLTVRYLDYD
jgi:DNA modification methylase